MPVPMDDERLKNGGSVLTKEYFEHLLERIREIRLSARRFYQKIADIYDTSTFLRHLPHGRKTLSVLP